MSTPVEIHNCTFESNQATEGGAVAAKQNLPGYFESNEAKKDNKPLNLLMNAAKSSGSWSCTMSRSICQPGGLCAIVNNSLIGKCVDHNVSDPSNPGESDFKLLSEEECIRTWEYGSETFVLIKSSLFRNNAAKSNSTVLAFGGALSAHNVNLTMRDTTMERNKVIGPLGSAGGGISLGPGTAFLSATRSTLKGNMAEEDASHSTIYSASAAQILLDNVQLIDIEAGSALMLQNSGGISLSKNSSLKCAAGSNLQFHISTTAQTFRDWRIDCSHVVNQTNKSYVNPTCEQLHGGQCKDNYAFLSPVMSVSAGTVACVACAPGLYSLDLSTKHGNSIPSVVVCLPCPYSAGE
jgi:predicted outer membrane repeat protein